MGEFPSKGIGKIVMGLLRMIFWRLMSYLNEDFFFFYEFAVADHISLTVREKGRFLGHCLRKKQELGGTRFKNYRLAYYSNVCLGHLQYVASLVKTQT